MSALIGTRIERENGRTLAIHPFKKDRTTGGGYDLSIGYWMVGEYKDEDGQIHVVSQGNSDSEEHEIEICSSGYLAVIAKEYIYLGDHYVGTIHAKAGLASRGLFLNSTTVDPKWSGRMTFHLRNISNRPMKISSHTSFATMLMHEIKPSFSNHPLFPQDALTRVVQDWIGDKSKAESYLRCEDDNESRQISFRNRKSEFEKISHKVFERHVSSPISLFRIASSMSKDENLRSKPLSWIWISLIVGILSVVASLIIYLVDAQYKFWVAGGFAIFALAFLITIMLNPATIYLRLLTSWLLVGGSVSSLGGAVDLYSDKIPYLNNFKWSSNPSPTSQVIWLLVLIVLVYADLRSRVLSNKF